MYIAFENTPIWAFHGAIDKRIPVTKTERIVNALQKQNGNIKFTKLEDKGHMIYDLYETNPEIFKWMLQQNAANHVIRRNEETHKTPAKK